MSQGSFRKISKVFQVRLKGVSSNLRGVSRVFQISLKGVSGKFQWCFKDVSKKFQRSFKCVSIKFQGQFKEVSRVFQESFKGVSSKIEGCLNGVLSGFQGGLKEVKWVFENSCKGVSRKIEWCSLRPSQWRFKGASRVSERSSKGVSIFEGCLKKGQVCLKKISNQNFKGVSKMLMKICFAILFCIDLIAATPVEGGLVSLVR